jgi:hypothetical protein
MALSYCVCVFFEHAVGLVVDFLTIIWIAKGDDDSTNRKKEGFLSANYFNSYFLKVFSFRKKKHTHTYAKGSDKVSLV